MPPCVPLSALPPSPCRADQGSTPATLRVCASNGLRGRPSPKGPAHPHLGAIGAAHIAGCTLPRGVFDPGPSQVIDGSSKSSSRLVRDRQLAVPGAIRRPAPGRILTLWQLELLGAHVLDVVEERHVVLSVDPITATDAGAISVHWAFYGPFD